MGTLHRVVMTLASPGTDCVVNVYPLSLRSTRRGSELVSRHAGQQ